MVDTVRELRYEWIEPSGGALDTAIWNKNISYRKETVWPLHNIEIIGSNAKAV